MTIDNDISKLTTPSGYTGSDRIQSELQHRAPDKSHQETGPSSTTDTVSLTETAAHMQDLMQRINEQPVADMDRVNALRQSIENGTFEVDSTAVADRMLTLSDQIERM